MTLEKFTHQDMDDDILLVQKFHTGDVVINVNNECVHVSRKVLWQLISWLTPNPKPVEANENIGSLPV